VLAAQRTAIGRAVPGGHWNDPHEAALHVLVEGMIDLGLLAGDRDGRIEDESYRRFFMHRTGHWLGMDVHDVGDYRVDDDWRQLEPGMCLTIEPGLYIPPAEDVPERLHGIGVRIEDDVHVTREGHEILTDGLAKSVEDIEALMRD